MQTSGVFPELNAGLKKSRPKPRKAGGIGGFAIHGRAPKRISNPKSFAGRRAASHSKARGDR